MAIVTTNATTQDLGRGVTRYFVVQADISTVATLLAASGTAVVKRRIKYASLDFSAAGQVEIKRTTGTVKQVWYKRLGGAANVIIDDADKVISNGNELLQIEASAAMTCDGYIDFIEGPDPA